MILLPDCAWDIHCMSKLPVCFRPVLIANSHTLLKHLAVKKFTCSESQKDLLYTFGHTSQLCRYLRKNTHLQVYLKFLLLLQVILVSANKLTRYIEPCQLTEDFGGTLTYDHMDWLNKRLVSFLLCGFCLVFVVCSGFFQMFNSWAMNFYLCRNC